MLRKILRDLLRELLANRPGEIYILVERQTMTKFDLKVLLPATVDGDVASREFTHTINSDTPVVTPLAKDATEFSFSAPRDAVVQMSLVDIDLAGNRSLPSTRSFTVVDTIPPHQPGELSVTVSGQHEETPPPEPPPAG